VSNGAYTGCDLPEIVRLQHQQSSVDDSEPVANECIAESADADSSPDLSTCVDVPPVCDDNDNVTSFPLNGFVGSLSNVVTDVERTRVDKSPHDQQVDSEPSDNGSVETVIGLSNTAVEAAASFNDVENVENIVENRDASQTCQLLVASAETAPSCEFDSVPSPVNTLTTNLSPVTELPAYSLPYFSMQESVPDTNAIEQPHRDADAVDKQDTSHTCQSLAASTVAAESCQFDSIPPPGTAVSVNLPAPAAVHSSTDIAVQQSVPDTGATEPSRCETSAAEKQDTNQLLVGTVGKHKVGSSVMTESCEFDSVMPLHEIGLMLVNLTDDVHSLRDDHTQQSAPDVDADVETLRCDRDATENIAGHACSELSSAQYSPQSVEMSHNKSGSDAELSIGSDVLQSVVDSGTGISAETSGGNYLSDLSHVTCPLDTQIAEGVKSYEQSLAETGLNGKAAGSCRNVSVYSPKKRQSFSDVRYIPSVSSGSSTAHRSDATVSTHPHLGNSGAVLDVATANTNDISPSLSGNAETNCEVLSPVLTAQLDVASGRCMTAIPTNVELQQKIIRQMEVCIELPFFLNFFFSLRI